MEKPTKLTREQAETEVKAWFEKKKTFQETQERYKDHSDLIVEAMMNGVLALDPSTFEFIHVLLFPIGEESHAQITELRYKARINDKQISAQMRGVKSDDVDGRLNALIAALTTQSRAFISNLDSGDKRIATAIGIFFM